MNWHNWSRTVVSRPAALEMPRSEAEVIDLLRAAQEAKHALKVVGAGHSCSQIAAGDRATVVSLERLAGLIAIDPAHGTATFGGGTTLRQINAELAARGLAIANLPAIDAPTIAGAIATGTHGSGLALGSLAASVVGARLITAGGEVMDIDDGELLDAVRVHLGCLGVLTRVTLACVDAFDLACDEQRVPLDEVLADLDARNERMFGFWWFPHVDHVIARSFEPVVRRDRRRARLPVWWSSVVVGNRFHEAMLYASARGLTAVAAVNERQLRVAFGPAGRARRTEGTSSQMLLSTILVKQRVLEYAIPYERAKQTIAALRELIEREQLSLHAPIDVRFSDRETAWLGLAHGRRSCYIGIVAYRPFGRDVDYERTFRAIDSLLRAADGRPHWGKLHYQDAGSLRPLYPRFADFCDVRARLDPRGVFLNPYLERVLGVSA